jgi:hypothetical protein
LDYVLPGQPAFKLPHGKVVRLNTQSTTVFDVVISSSEDAIQRRPNCMDGEEVFADRTYLLSRVVP